MLLHRRKELLEVFMPFWLKFGSSPYGLRQPLDIDSSGLLFEKNPTNIVVIASIQRFAINSSS
tara:strand:+ start:1656 stop:1844 length:189 start_codon:yes stop_codon:yes gene_type:complete